ncbi:hypothetical protein NY406_05265 [Chlorobaculum sp. MV4-Y]|uniref:hypothetical protein n=1 Tax=Chlorobaculum sp. MV4-Y TaxID=2976335 RepID=UPI0021B0612D|nr:hypothetical protein [Chlorobaculum sp. MV4-Y]UWX58672.1 hypothetical protein NY406_05265 [Chlorobaculum sp. MV4-Y]
MIPATSGNPLRGISRTFLVVSFTIIAIAATGGGLGVLVDNAFLLKLHPYIFFVGFGNLAILIFNRYLTASIYPELRIDPRRQRQFIAAVLVALVMVTVSVAADLPFLKAAAGLMLMAVVALPLYDILTTLSVTKIWNEVSVRYYIFDVVFLLNANLGLFTLGLKEAVPDNGIIPFFVTQSSYFLGSSFPLSISVMGFLYTYAWRRTDKMELAKKLFSLWFYIFVGGVLYFLIVILMGDYLGMMLISHLLTFGVMALLYTFGVFLRNYFRDNFAHPALAFMLGGLAFLFATSAFGILNIYYAKGILFGSYPPIRGDKMWIYHSHTHSALLGWITLSFIGMIYIVLPAIQKTGSLELLQSGDPLEQLLDERTMNRAFVSLSIILVAGVAIIVSFFSGEQLVLGIGGIVYAAAALYLLRNLIHDPVFETGDKS